MSAVLTLDIDKTPDYSLDHSISVFAIRTRGTMTHILLYCESQNLINVILNELASLEIKVTVAHEEEGAIALLGSQRFGAVVANLRDLGKGGSADLGLFRYITAHFPALIAEASSPIVKNSLISLVCNSTASLGALSIAVIGLFNIIGSISAGALGKNFSKKYLLSLIYLWRTIAAILFIMLPITPLSVIIFSVVMGTLWLATVPLTSGIIAHIYGLQYMGTLYGIVFFSHQLGSFVGVWLGGLFYDIYGNYNIVWWVGIGVGAFSAIIHLPVKEIPLVNRMYPRFT
jgi:MFS family permease